FAFSSCCCCGSGDACAVAGVWLASCATENTATARMNPEAITKETIFLISINLYLETKTCRKAFNGRLSDDLDGERNALVTQRFRKLADDITVARQRVFRALPKKWLQEETS